jgi:uncharacterized membrane protein
LARWGEEICEVEDMINFLFRWQTLMGSIIGASIPIFFWLLQRRYEDFVKFKNNLLFLERMLVASINNIVQIKGTIEYFLNTKIDPMISAIGIHTNVYNAESAFFPMFFTVKYGDNIFSLNLKSAYLENKINQVATMSNDIVASIEDARRQFQHCIESNMRMASQKLNPPSIQNDFFKKNLEEFKKITKKEILDTNFNIYFVRLVESRTAVQTLLKDINRYGCFGFTVWKLRFSSDCRYFKNRKILENFKKDFIARIEAYVIKQISMYKELEDRYIDAKSKFPKDFF